MLQDRLIVIGSSYGGIAAVTSLVRQLPAHLPAAVLVVQHTSPQAHSVLPAILSRVTSLPVAHPTQFEPIRCGRIYVAPPDRHMLITPERRFFLARGPEENGARPAIDATLRSAALTHGAAVIAVILTGELTDGTAGALAVKDHGGIVVVQDPEDAAARSMPLSVACHVDIDHCCPLAAMGQLLATLAQAPSGPARIGPKDSLLQIENRIASGLLDATLWGRLAAMSTPAARVCPVCGQAMFELGDRRIRRVRCRAGHASAVDPFEVKTPLSPHARSEMQGTP